VWNVSQSFQCKPDEAWALMGRPALTPRQTRRLTFAALELAALDRSLDTVTERTKGVTSDDVLRVKEMEDLFNEARQPVYDRIAAEIERELAVKGELAEGERVAPFAGSNVTEEQPEGEAV